MMCMKILNLVDFLKFIRAGLTTINLSTNKSKKRGLLSFNKIQFRLHCILLR